ncbi:MAG: P1 family peptidase [Thermicanus sp.]|nr:P1 family peptidase [Thermicanus sp.]
MERYGNITDVPGIKVGNWEDHEALTGCTVILCEEGAVAGVDVRGSAPGTRETDLLNPLHLVQQVHAITLSGGSAFGLDAASGVMRYLEERGIGLDVGIAKVPIVPAAVLFDLAVGNPHVRPGAEMGYEAAKRATRGDFPQGNVGAGCGATVGKVAGLPHCMKGGLGSASIAMENGVVVGALVAVNALGEVRNPENGELLAGVRDVENGKLLDSIEVLGKNYHSFFPGTNTTIGVVAIGASLTKPEANKIAQMAHDGLARTIYPVHTMHDGDTLFALGTGGPHVPVDLVGTLAAKAVELAVIRAIKEASSIPGIPAWRDLNR